MPHRNHRPGSKIQPGSQANPHPSISALECPHCLLCPAAVPQLTSPSGSYPAPGSLCWCISLFYSCLRVFVCIPGSPAVSLPHLQVLTCFFYLLDLIPETIIIQGVSGCWIKDWFSSAGLHESPIPPLYPAGVGRGFWICLGYPWLDSNLPFLWPPWAPHGHFVFLE